MLTKNEELRLPVVTLDKDIIERMSEYKFVEKNDMSPLSLFNIDEFYTQFDESEEARSLCPYYVEGSCKFGSNCRNRHPAQTRGTCLICKVDIKSSLRQYGILSNCNCIFCLPCIRQRRGRGNAEEVDKKTCPICHVYSTHLLGSKILLLEEAERKELVRYLISTNK